MPLPRTLRGLTARLTQPVETLDAADLAGRVRRTGCAHVSTLSRGDHATVTGRVRTVVTCGGGDFLGLTAEVFDGTGAVAVCWLGRRAVPGIDTGRFIRVTGRVGLREGRKIMFNPRYELLDGQPASAGGGAS